MLYYFILLMCLFNLPVFASNKTAEVVVAKNTVSSKIQQAKKLKLQRNLVRKQFLKTQKEMKKEHFKNVIAIKKGYALEIRETKKSKVILKDKALILKKFATAKIKKQNSLKSENKRFKLAVRSARQTAKKEFKSKI